MIEKIKISDIGKPFAETTAQYGKCTGYETSKKDTFIMNKINEIIDVLNQDTKANEVEIDREKDNQSINGEPSWYRCPQCEGTIIYDYTTCHDCGSKIKWINN